MKQGNECKGCWASTRHPFDEVAAKMKEFLAAVPEEERITDEEYQKRLNKCTSCADLYFGSTCRYCGCFVQIRAIRKIKDCPYPGGSKWGLAE